MSVVPTRTNIVLTNNIFVNVLTNNIALTLLPHTELFVQLQTQRRKCSVKTPQSTLNFGLKFRRVKLEHSPRVELAAIAVPAAKGGTEILQHG